MNYEEFDSAVKDAETTMARASAFVRMLARLAVGRLRRSKVSHHVLAELKRELRDYNIHTGRWK